MASLPDHAHVLQFDPTADRLILVYYPQRGKPTLNRFVMARSQIVPSWKHSPLDKNNTILDKYNVIVDKYKVKPGEHKVKPIGFHVKLVQYLENRAETKCYLSNISRNRPNSSRNPSKISRSAPKQRCIHPVSLCISAVFRRICTAQAAKRPYLLDSGFIGQTFSEPTNMSNGAGGLFKSGDRLYGSEPGAVATGFLSQ